MKIVSWNINSVRLRAQTVVRMMDILNPDIVCLQETKTPDEFFPHEIFSDAGYAHQHIQGMKSYNGLAILSKHPFIKTEIHHRCGKEDCRHIAAHFEGFDLHNLYIPAGGDEPDPDINDKFVHKLNFVEEMTEWFADKYKSSDRVVTVGDFNIAPYEHDVWSHKQLLNVVSHTPPETKRLEAMRQSLDFVDSARKFVPMDEKSYSWWSYRNRDWRKSNRGRRLDHIWVSKPLENALKKYAIHEDARDWDKPSDHIPIMIELDLSSS